MEPNELFVTFKQFTKEYPWPSESSLRHIRFDEEKNGFKGAFINMGRRVLIDVNKFWECLRKQEAKKPLRKKRKKK